ncbi:phosphatase PAP2 family protein [Candidatus Woesearchaeota archaeon]|nr:phosphatase PAP2 family protein [Candidatus Woesearchaeota archaeon]
MHSLVEKHVNDFFRDITGFGGLWGYLTFVVLTYVMVGTYFAAQLVVALVIIYASAVIIRLLYFKDRPNHERHKSVLERVDASSFPSIHAARITSMAYLFARQVPELVIPSVLLSLLVCASRVYLRKHFVIDVIGGIVLGVLVAVVVSKYV